MAADDCDGSLLNGTPHASAIYTALSRHGIAAGSASDPQNQNNDCTETDLSVSLAVSSLSNDVIATITNEGGTTDPNARLDIEFKAPQQFTVTPQGAATQCVLTSFVRLLHFAYTYSRPAIELPGGSNSIYSWSLVLPGVWAIVSGTVSGDLSDTDPANNEAALCIDGFVPGGQPC